MKDIQRDILDKLTPEIIEEMKHIWFTADLHAQHPKIVNICNRPVYLSQKEIENNGVKVKDCSDPGYKRLINFANDQWLIKDVINNYVGKRDRLYILGDVTMANKIASDKFLDRLNGNKTLIAGNHDKNISHSTRFTEITQLKDFTFGNKATGLNIHIVLCHYPMLSWNRRIHGSWHLYGHVHGRNPGVGRSHDVGIDNSINMWRPLNLYEICLIMKDKPIWNEDVLEWNRGYDEGSDI